MADIYDSLKPILTISKALGLGPFFLDTGQRSLRLSFRGLIYSILVMLLFNGDSVAYIYNRVENYKDTQVLLKHFTTTVAIGCGILIRFCCVLFTIVQRKKMRDMINGFHDIDAELRKLDIHLPHQKAVWYARSTLAALTLLLAILTAHDIYMMKDLRPNDPYSFWIIYFSSTIYGTVVIYQFVTAGTWLKVNFSKLNDRLVNFGDEGRNSHRQQKKIGWIEGDGYFGLHGSLKPTPALWKGDFSKFRLRKISPADMILTIPFTPLSKVKAIRKIHSSLCDIKDLLNISFSLQLLISVAQAFVLITSNLYMVFTSLSDVKGSREMVSFYVIWTLFRAAVLLLIVQTCTRASHTANHTAVIVHKLLAKDWDIEVRNQLKLFSVQLLHRKISFSAFGFFNLDMTLLHAIVGAATTYLVILIQFHNAY